MSEIAVTPVNTPKSHIKSIVIAILILIPLLAYGAGTIVSPIFILINYQRRNCDTALSLHKIYTSIYPDFVQDKTIFPQVKECEAYKLAILNEEKGLWREAYNAYQAYSNTYPNGLYVKEAHEQGAIALLTLVKDQITQKQYDEAVTNLKSIIANDMDTSVSTEALELLSSTYDSWGVELREAAAFEKAEQVFNDFRSWTLSNQKTELESTAQNELVQTYITWGVTLRDQKQFEGALAKFDLAVTTDPQSQPDSAAQIKTGQRSVYIAWGNDLLEQDQFSAAIEKFQLAISRSGGANEDGVNDVLANGYLQWGHDFSAHEDFDGALKQLDVAKQTAVSKDMKKLVDAAFSDTYLAFSNSTGTQARRAMKEALIAICDKHKKTNLPIFGLNKDVIHMGIYGVDAKLPEGLAANTPGEMHYVACVDESNRTVQSRSVKVILLTTSQGYYYTFAQQYRAELIWDFDLIKIDAMERVAQKTFIGGTPPPFNDAKNSGNYFYGPPPTINELVQWLQPLMK